MVTNTEKNLSSEHKAPGEGMLSTITEWKLLQYYSKIKYFAGIFSHTINIAVQQNIIQT